MNRKRITSSIFIGGDFSLDAIFKPIVVLTLGLGIPGKLI